MNIMKSFALAIKSILSSKARSFLTMLGIIIGVAAVIVIVGLGNGMEIYMTDSFKSMGTNLLTVNIRGRNSSRSVSTEDMFALVDENRNYFSGMSPSVNINGTVKIGNETLSDTRVSGVGEDFTEMNGYELSNGRFVEYVDTLKNSKVCIVGSYVNREYYNGRALGETLKINGNLFTIVGVMTERAESEEGSNDDIVYVPYSTAVRLGLGMLSSYSFAMVSEDDVTESKKVISDKLTEVFGDTNSYSITSMSEILNTMTSMINVMVVILAAIASISLVVGGIGIMNIMLVSVSERTREIGIRKALGAKRRHILSQFVIEAGTTSAIGGFLGILLGYALSLAATQAITVMLEEAMTVTPSSGSVLMAFSISAGIGVLFGYLPARKASVLNPIDALRYE